MTVLNRQPHVNSPECWCHPLAVTPFGHYMVLDGEPTKVLPREISSPNPFLNHQDAIGAATLCVPGCFIWKSPELRSGGRIV